MSQTNFLPSPDLQSAPARRLLGARRNVPQADANREILVCVESAGKKFCRDLKRSLWYGVRDICHELNPFPSREGAKHPRVDVRPGEFWALRDVSFELRRGECLGLIGRNGAGKTTLLRLLNGLIKPDTGRIEMRGRIGALIALGAGFNPILTGRENIYVNGSVLGLSKREVDQRLEEIVDFADIGDFIDMPVQSYSSGMQVRLGFAVASAMEPDVLILDEVLAVGDAAFRAKCFNRMYSVLENAAVIFVSHNMPQVTRVSSRMMLLHEGRVLAHDSELGTVIEKYYGLSAHEKPSSSHGEAIKAVWIEDDHGRPAQTIQHGQPFSIVVSVASEYLLDRPDLRIHGTISDREETNVIQFTQPITGRWSATDDFEFVMHFGSTPLSAGTYLLNCSIVVGTRGRILSFIRNTCPFTVVHCTAGYAPVILEVTSTDLRAATFCHSPEREGDNDSVDCN